MNCSKRKKICLILTLLLMPTVVDAKSYSSFIDLSHYLNFNAVFQSGAVVNNASSNDNMNIIIIGMIVVILILVGAAMFAPKK